LNRAVIEKKSGLATLADIRSSFPALQRMHSGQPIAYFDGPGGTQVPTAVVGAIGDYLLPPASKPTRLFLAHAPRWPIS